ncbi:hypothetical protein [Natronobeatus ordinarius]|uniref:hypothetical protein n=1 Tax=Natronobeatus ordinarius TaxID=2963433 RepID=UPI0020CD1A02|nr:hypothetical protein [Natronobeatus ordinarius]
MIVVVPVPPPREGLVLSSLTEETPLSTAEVTRLAEAATMDVLHAARSSGGDLLVNYRDEETLPDAFDDGDPEAEVRDLVQDTLGEDAEFRLERQVGSTRAARVGNTVTHLLNREDAASVGVLEPTAPLVARTEIDGAAMSVRRTEVVLGPAGDGSVYFAAFADPIDFTDAYEPPALETLARRGESAGLDVGFAPAIPTITTETGLCATIAGLEARRAAGRPIPEATALVVDDLGLTVEDGPTLGRE